MSGTLPTLLQAMLRGLIQAMGATDGAIVLPESSAAHPHLLVRVGRLDTQGWYALLDDAPSDLLDVPLRSRAVEGRAGRLYVYRPGQQTWGRAATLSVSAVAAGVDYLLDVPGDDFNWMQLVASRRILSVTEEELTRIVLDIHDGPVQKLFAATNHLLHLRATLERDQRAGHSTEGGELLPEIVHVVDLLESSMAEIRTFLGAFQSAEVAERPLLEVLEALVVQHEQLTGSTVHFDCGGRLPTVSVPVKLALYRILQEALTNAHRHAQVCEHFVRLWDEGEQLQLEVIDHGRGFTPPALDGPGATEEARHIGLRGMRDRLYLVGGTLRLRSAPGEGTTIHVSVPVS